MIRRGAFYILRNAQGQFSLWPQQCLLPAGWDVVCQPQSQASCQQWLEAHWRTLTPANFTQLQGHNEPAFTFGRRTARHLDGRKTVRFTLRTGVAHYVELTGG